MLCGAAQKPLMCRLDSSRVVLIGHSFGGATVLTAAARAARAAHSQPVRAVVALDPATGWLPDDERGLSLRSHKGHGCREER